MKKTYQTMKVILLFVSVALLASCVEEYEYEPTIADSNVATQKAYILTAKTVLDLENSEPQKLELTVERPDGSAATIIHLITNNSKFKVSQSVEFKAGEKTKKINVNFDMRPASTEEVNIKMDDAQAYGYGNTELDITANRYIPYHVNWDSWYYGWMFKNIDVMEFPKGTYTIEGLHTKAEWTGSDMGTITFRKDSENILHMKPQYIHTQKWNNDGMKDFWIVSLYSDSEKLWKKVDIDALTRGECGKYYPDDDIFELWLRWYSLNWGWWTNNGNPEQIVLLD